METHREVFTWALGVIAEKALLKGKTVGIDATTREDLARLDRKRKKPGSNQAWKHPHDGAARIAKMKDGRTHLAHKAEHTVDLETGAALAVTLQGANQGDTTTAKETFIEAAEQLEEVGKEPGGG